MQTISFRAIIFSTLLLGAAFVSGSGLTNLKSQSLEQREEGADAIRKKHDDIVEQLIELASQEVEPYQAKYPGFPKEYPWRDSKHLSIILLGEWRCVKAVSTLIDNLEYMNPENIFADSLPRAAAYPAAVALAEIGVPALAPTIEKLGSYDKDCLGRELCCWVIGEALGAKLGRIQVAMGIEKTKDPKVKANLEAALVYFKTLDEKSIWERRKEKEKARRSK